MKTLEERTAARKFIFATPKWTASAHHHVAQQAIRLRRHQRLPRIVERIDRCRDGRLKADRSSRHYRPAKAAHAR